MTRGAGGKVPENLDGLVRYWEGRDGTEWRRMPERYLEAGSQAISLGQPTLAFDILREGLVSAPGHPGMQYKAALALANSGAIGSALHMIDALLGTLDKKSPEYPDALSLAGRIHKERSSRIAAGDSRQEAMHAAAVSYQLAYEVSGDYFPGINAASMNMLAGRKKEGKRIAREVLDQCLEMQGDGTGDHWLEATLGEAYLLLDRQEDAASAYRCAAELAGGRLGDIASMRRQVKLLERCLQVAPEVMQALNIRPVLVFTGHMIDAPDRRQPRFPASIEDAVRASIRAKLDRIDPGFAFCSLACGADILFAEEIIRRGAELNVYLPFRSDDFIEVSVAFAGEDWVRRFERALEKATSVTYAINEEYLGDDVLFEYTTQLIHGAAMLRARQMETEAGLLAVLEVDQEGKIGGATETVGQWEACGPPADIIDIAGIREQVEKETPTPVQKRAAVIHLKPAGKGMRNAEAWGRRQIKTMVFADVVGFSKLSEAQEPAFFVHFLGEIAKQIDTSDIGPIFWNTWGDGLFLVFEGVVGAADFAIGLRDHIARTDWEKKGLPKDTNIRIGMHAGPVFPIHDPILDRENYFGSHVNLAARIEPVTMAGSVFVSEQAACLLAVVGEGYACDYLGLTQLAKEFRECVLYRLRRANETE